MICEKMIKTESCVTFTTYNPISNVITLPQECYIAHLKYKKLAFFWQNVAKWFLMLNMPTLIRWTLNTVGFGNI